MLIHLAYPWVLALVPLIGAISALRKSQEPAIQHPSLSWLTGPRSTSAKLRALLLFVLKWSTIVLCALSASRPQHLAYLEQNSLGRDLMLTVDISPSMGTSDFDSKNGAISRLEGVKAVLSEFISQRKDDRLGLVLFAGQAFIQSPLTRDHSIVESFVSRLRAGAAGDGTAIGDGLSLALKHLLNLPKRTKAVVLLTDGANNTGHVSPLRAVSAAKELSIAVHTIGIGAPGQPSTAEAGQLRPQYDEELLTNIASSTGGVFFNARSLEGLRDVYAQINQLETSPSGTKQVRRVKEYFGIFAAAALCCYMLYLFVALNLLPKLP